jgi:hypothetical protein
MKTNQGLGKIFVAGLLLLGGITPAARAEDEVANPKYTAWSKFKPGSSNTVSADVDMGGTHVHINVKRTLISVTDAEVVVELKSTVTVMGRDQQGQPIQQTFDAKADKDVITQKGQQDVDAMGKTFKCTVYEATTKEDVKPDPQAKPMPGANAKTATVYTSDDVPGGLVKLETQGQDGKSMVFILTAMEAK